MPGLLQRQARDARLEKKINDDDAAALAAALPPVMNPQEREKVEAAVCVGDC